MNLPVFRYVALDLTDNYALQIETDRWLKIGDKITRFDSDDMKTHIFRILRLEGTVYNKEAKETSETAETLEAKEAIA